MKDKNLETDKADSMLDDLFRRTMENHSTEPSPKVWKEIGRGLFWDDLLHFRFTNLSFRYWAVFTMIMLITGLSLYFLPWEDELIVNEQPVPSDVKGVNSPVVSDPDISPKPVGIFTSTQQSAISGSREADMPLPGETGPADNSQSVSTFIASELPDIRHVEVFRLAPVYFQLFGNNIPDSIRIIHTVHGDVKVSESTDVDRSSGSIAGKGLLPC
jgi:hypothetical protein